MINHNLFFMVKTTNNNIDIRFFKSLLAILLIYQQFSNYFLLLENQNSLVYIYTQLNDVPILMYMLCV